MPGPNDTPDNAAGRARDDQLDRLLGIFALGERGRCPERGDGERRQAERQDIASAH